MTGAEVRRQVVLARAAVPATGPTTLDEYRAAFWPLYGATAAFDEDCIVLTAEEATWIRIRLAVTAPVSQGETRKRTKEAIALLTPEQS